MTAAALLAVRGLAVRFGGVTAIEDLTFEVTVGEVLALIGPNGAGKTSAFNAITGYLAPSGGEIVFAGVRLNLLLGRFNYAERGILDVTHKRLFTRATLLRTLRDSGYRIESIRPVGAPFQTVVGGSLGKLLGQIANALARLWPTMFAFQFMVTCRPMPGVKQVVGGQE